MFLHNMDQLVGKKIINISINNDQSILTFTTDHGTINYRVEGDCCSESWFADITGVNTLIGAIVRSTDEVHIDSSYNVNDGRTRQEGDEAYSYKIVTNMGYADIVFRNSSNGFYGGWLTLFDGVLPEDMTPITDDWHA